MDLMQTLKTLFCNKQPFLNASSHTDFNKMVDNLLEPVIGDVCSMGYSRGACFSIFCPLFTEAL